MSATIIGAGVYFARIKGHFKLFHILGALLVAILFHATYNLLVQFSYLRVIAVLLPIAVFILLFIILRRKTLYDFLWDKKEYNSGK